MDLNVLETFGGVYSETTAIRHILDLYGATSAHNNKPLSEAMLFGISGGIGFAYFNFEYEGYEPTLYIGVAQRYKTRFGQYMDSLYKRLSLETTVKMTRSSQEAEKFLVDALTRNQPVLLHVDRGFLPYYAEETEYGDHAIVVIGYEDASGDFLVADQAQVPITITRPDLSAARESIAALSNRSLTIAKPSAPIDLSGGIEAGIRQCWDKMLNPPNPKNNFGLPGLEKWAELINNARIKKGWPKVFPPGLHLYVGLQWTFKCIQLLDTGGGGLRGMYADFLEEASEVVNRPGLKDLAKRYRTSEQLWTDLAQAALPDEVPLFKATKELLTRTEHLFLEKGMESIPEMEGIRQEQNELTAQATTDFPLNAQQSQELLDDLHDRLVKIIDVEREASETLKNSFN